MSSRPRVLPAGCSPQLPIVLYSNLTNAATDVLVALMGALPLVAAIRAGYSYRVFERELVAQYHYMERVFSNANRLLHAASTDDERRQVLFAVGEASFDENGLWILRNRERPISGSSVTA